MPDTIELGVATWGKSTPILKLLKQKLDDLTDLNESIALGTEEMIRLWIIDAAPSRHTVAQALGAEPTGYLTRAAEQTTSTFTDSTVTVTVKGEIFKRWKRDVEVLPRRAKMLTMPVNAEAYGRTAREFKDLRIAKSKKGTLFLVRDKGRGKNKTTEALFMLLPRATLPRDADLLPGPKRRAETAERVARDYIALVIQKGGLKL